MKTNQVMSRKMGQFEVKQRTKDGFFNATELLSQWNNSKGSSKEVKEFIRNKGTQDFIKEIETQENLNRENYPYLSTRGKNGGTWMHPLLFIDFAMWLNPSFKYHVLKFVHDQLIQYRKDSGDSYRKMCDALYPAFSNGIEFGKFIAQEAIKIKQACGVSDWNEATEEQLNKRKTIEEAASILSDVVPPQECIRLAIKKTLK